MSKPQECAVSNPKGASPPSYGILPVSSCLLQSQFRVDATCCALGKESRPALSAHVLKNKMATPGFGFSVGDVLAGLHVVRKLIRALNDTGGSRVAYQTLIAELLNLEDALRGVNDLQVDPMQAAQKLALEQVAEQCQKTIEKFLAKNAKFKDSLGARPSTMSAWRSNFHKVQWALCKESEIDALRTEIAAHSTTLNIILSTVRL